MRERLKRAVLKTAVPERVPGVRIPLPPPYARWEATYSIYCPACISISELLILPVRLERQRERLEALSASKVLRPATIATSIGIHPIQDRANTRPSQGDDFARAQPPEFSHVSSLAQTEKSTPVILYSPKCVE
jgi:hypothetical protein